MAVNHASREVANPELPRLPIMSGGGKYQKHEEHTYEIGWFESREPACKVLFQRDAGTTIQVMRGERQSKDESAQYEEQVDSAPTAIHRVKNPVCRRCYGRSLNQ